MLKTSFYATVLACVTLLTGNHLFAQKGDKKSPELLDNAYMECQYTYSYARDTLQLNERKEDRMLLHIGKDASKFYSYKTAVADSARKADIANNLSQVQMLANLNKYKTGVSEMIYKTGENLLTIDKLVMNHFKIEEVFPLFHWNITEDTPDNTMEIIGYQCRKATCWFRGRNYIAWFASDIPISNGPWKFSGLPGLIMKIYDTNNHYSWEIIGIRNVTDLPIVLENEQYITTTREKFAKTMKHYRENPLDYMAGVGVKVTVRDQSGKPLSKAELKKTNVTVGVGDSVTSIQGTHSGYDPIER